MRIEREYGCKYPQLCEVHGGSICHLIKSVATEVEVTEGISLQSWKTWEEKWFCKEISYFSLSENICNRMLQGWFSLEIGI